MCETYSEDLIPGPLILRAWAVSYTYVSVCVCVCVRVCVSCLRGYLMLDLRDRVWWEVRNGPGFLFLNNQSPFPCHLPRQDWQVQGPLSAASYCWHQPPHQAVVSSQPLDQGPHGGVLPPGRGHLCLPLPMGPSLLHVFQVPRSSSSSLFSCLQLPTWSQTHGIECHLRKA